MSVVAIEPLQAQRPPGPRALPSEVRVAGSRSGVAQPECTCPEYCELDHAND